MKDLYVVNCCRTAIGSFGGSLKNTPAAEMGAVVVKEALKRANIAPENVDEVMFGCILTAAQGQNVARQVAIKAGIPYSVPAYTVGMVCGSGMKSVIEGARSILAGDSDVVVCGGTENMSAAPFASMDARWGARMGDKKLVDTMIKDGLWDAYNNYHMGTTAENINDIWGITREEQDAFAAASQQKTEAAQKAGRFDDEIVPVMVKVKKEMVPFAKDEYPKAGVTKEGIAKLRGAFPVERKAGICPNGIVARIVAVVINGQGKQICSRNVGRNVLCGSFSVHNIAFIHLLPVGIKAENHSAGVCGVVKADFCRKGPYIYSADVKIKLGDIAGISVVLRINGKTLVKALGADFYVGICLDGIVGIVYDLPRGKGGHVHIARMGKRESNRCVAENGKSVTLCLKSDRLCSRGKCGLKLFKLIL